MPPVTVEASAPLAEPPPREQEGSPEPNQQRIETRIAAVLLALLPGALVVYFSFNSGGFFPSSVGFVTLLVTAMSVLRVLVAERPFAGFTARLGIVAALFTGYAAWTLASQLWSDTQDRALIEFDRALLYLSLLVLFGLLPRPRWRMPWILRGLTVATLLVCTCALITRILPHVWPTSPGFVDNRLSFPLTYWNSLGILAAIGVVLALGTAANPSENRWFRAIAAAFVPVAATTLLFTFSRGAILAAVVGVVALMAVARSAAIGALLSVAAPTAVSLVAAYQADLLATTDPTQPGAISQGQDVAVVVAICAVVAAALRLLTLGIDRVLAERTRKQWSREAKLLAAGAFAAAVVVAAIAVGAPSWVSKQYDGFVHGGATTTTDLRSRLTDPSSNGRSEHWRVALKGFSSDPIKGQGAGTYQFLWERQRKDQLTVVDGHSLYLEVLSELGLPGLLLLAGTIAAILWTLLRRARGPNRMTYAVLFAAALTWALHAGIDWDWEMPAVTAWVFAVGGAALASRLPKRRSEPMGDRGRIPIAAALLVVGVTPALLMLSQYSLQGSGNAFDKGDCKQATHEAITSINVVAIRPEPYQILGYCNMEDGNFQEAVAAMRKAVEQQPKSWEYHFGLALAQGHAGIDPRPEAALALRLNPREDLVKQAVTGFGHGSRASWLKTARDLESSARVSGRLSLR
jgi:O-antigen ligase/polysaccharide polymerase Wzy-like membrane protein